MKKFFKGLIITLVVLIILPIALAFIFLFDTGKMPVKYDDDFSAETWVKNVAVDSLDYTESDKVIRLKATEEDINNFIHSELKKQSQVSKYLTQFALDIQDDQYVVNASGKIFFFETRAKLHTKLSKETITSVTSGESKEAFVLSVEKVSLGRLSQLKQVINFFLTKLVNDSTIDGLTSSIKLHSDLKNNRLYIYTSDLREMLNKGINSGAGDKEYFLTFVNDFLNMGLINIDFYGGEALTVDINLEPLTGNDFNATVGNNVYYPVKYEDTLTKITINDEERKLSLDAIRDAIVYLLDKGYITFEQVSLYSDYLYHGYSEAYNPDSNVVDKLGIANKETYKGFNLTPSETMDTMFANAISTFSDYNTTDSVFDIARISESDINTFLHTQNALGFKYFIQREVSDGHNKVNYIALDNAYINFYDTSKSEVTIGLNLNGLETIVTILLSLDMDAYTAHNDRLTYNVDKIYFGNENKNLAISEDTKKVIFDALGEAANNQTFRFEDGKMTISFDSILNSAINATPASPYKTFLQAIQTSFRLNVEGENLTDNAVIKIQAER